MTQEQIEQKKADLVNDLIFLLNIEDELWRYHPENPSKVKVEVEWIDIKNKIQVVENELKQLG
jgi:hypothetical protein